MSKVESSRVTSKRRSTVGFEMTNAMRPCARVTRRRPLSSTLRPVESMNSTPERSIATACAPESIASLRRCLKSEAGAEVRRGRDVDFPGDGDHAGAVAGLFFSQLKLGGRERHGKATFLGGDRACQPCLCEDLPDVHPRDSAPDDQLLDLRGALEDVVDLRIPVPALDRELARVAVAAEDLDRPFGGPDGDFAGLELAHRALGVLEPVRVAAHPRCAPDQQAGGVDLELHAGQRERDRLVLDDLLAELLALLGVVQRVLVGGPRDAQRLGADGRAAGLEALHRGLAAAALALAHASEALVELLLAAQQRRARHAAVVEVDVS